jgi:ribosome biogenesis GTPase
MTERADDISAERDPGELEGLVSAVFGDRIAVRSHDGEVQVAYQSRKAGQAVTGDQVVLSRVEGGDEDTLWRVDAIQSRGRCLWRSSRRRSGQLVTANVDQLCVMVAVEPPPREGLVDRYLVSAEWEQIPALIVLNKIDLPGAARLIETFVQFARIGYPVHPLSAVSGEGVEEFAALLETGLTVMAGHSGVGKTTLLNRLIPGLDLETAELSSATGKGRHTTSVAIAHPFRNGTLVDTPGIREFGLVRGEPADLPAGFREFEPYLGECRFNDCAHVSEPGCVVRAAVERGDIHGRRYDSYVRIRESLEAGER